MKKRFFSTLLMGALVIASMSMFTSCKDYDDDINKNTSAIESLRKTIEGLESSLSAVKSELNEKNSSLATRLQALADDASKYATKEDLNKYSLSADLNKAVADLEGKIAKLVTAEALEKAIADAKALQEKIDAGKASVEDLKALQAEVAAIDPKLDQIGKDITALQTDVNANKGDIANLKKAVEDGETGLAAVNKNLDAQQKAISELENALKGKATNEDLNALYVTVQTITKQIADIDIPDVANLKETLEQKVKELADLKTELDALKSELSGYSNDIKAIAADNEANKKLIEELTQKMTDADGKVVNVTTELSVLNIFVEKGLTSIVLKPSHYIFGLEAIDVPMLVRQPVLYLDQNKKIKRPALPLFTDEVIEDNECYSVVNYGVFNPEAYISGSVLINSGNITMGQYTTWVGDPAQGQFTIGNGLMPYTCQANYWERGDFLEEWQLRQGVGQCTRVEGADKIKTDNPIIGYVEGVSSYVINDVHWPEGLEFAVPAAASYLSGYNYYYNGQRMTIDNNSSNFFNYGDDFNYNFYRYVDIFPQSHAYYNINPQSADLDGAKLHFNMNYPTETYITPGLTDQLNLTRADREPEDMLFVPNSGKRSLYDGAMEKNYIFTLSNDMVTNGVLDVPFSLDLQTYINTYVVNFISGYDARHTYSANGSLTESVTGIDFKSMKMPFTAAQITSNVGGSERVVTSDWAIITPSLLHIRALADNHADLRQALRWSWSDHNMVEQNHLYKTALDAINGQYTHDVVYNSSIDLAPFVETHYYQIGTEFARDKVMTPQLLQELGLHYEYVLVDWFSDNYAAQQSRHATIDRYTGKLTVRPVESETGKTITDQPGTISCVGKQPLVRVMLVQDVVNPAYEAGSENAALAMNEELVDVIEVPDGDKVTKEYVQKNILAVGYIKCRIVENENVDFFTTVDMNPDTDYEVYMDCPGLAIAKWSQIERHVYDVIGLTKDKFDLEYTLDCPTNEMGCKINGARRFVRISLKEYNSLLEANENSLNYPSDQSEETVAAAAGSDSIFVDEASYVKYIEYAYKNSKTLTIEKKVLTDLAFGEAYYRAFAGYVGWTKDMSPYNPYGDDARQLEDNVLYWYLGTPSSATPHQYMDNSTVDAIVDEKYIEHIAAVDKFGKSTKAIETWVRFKRRDGLNDFYVRLRIPAGKLIWANGHLINQSESYFFDFNSTKPVHTDYLVNPVAGTAGYYNDYAPGTAASVPEAHVNVPIPTPNPNSTYTLLDERDFGEDLTHFFSAGVQYGNDVNSGNYIQKFPRFTGWLGSGTYGGEMDKKGKTNLYQNDIEFWFTMPDVSKRNANFSAQWLLAQDIHGTIQHYTPRMLADTIYYDNHPVKVWQVRGKSGRKYMLTLANKDENGNLRCWGYDPRIGTIDFAGNQKYLYMHEGIVERGKYIVAISETEYRLENDQTGAIDPTETIMQGYVPYFHFYYDDNNNPKPVIIASLTDLNDWDMANPNIVYVQRQGFTPLNNYVRYHENAVAEDILNVVNKWNNFNDSYYTDPAKAPDENVDTWNPGHFTAYLEVVAKHCYEIFDPYQTRFFNIRFMRPVYYTKTEIDLKADAYSQIVTTGNVCKTRFTNGFKFSDWRNYTLNYPATSNTDKQNGDYYTLRIDNGHDGTIKYYSGGDQNAPYGWEFVDQAENQYLLDEIRTDLRYNDNVTYRTVEMLDGEGTLKFQYREPIDVETLRGRALIETLPVASRYATSGGTSKNADITLYIKDGYLWYDNVNANIDAFNLYVPVYWSYVLGDTHYVPVAGYDQLHHCGHFYMPWNASYNGGTAGDMDTYEYNYFRSRHLRDWAVIKVYRTVTQ
jgi:predicted  nucleic acid-binding Zn-ribbon protein